MQLLSESICRVDRTPHGEASVLAPLHVRGKDAFDRQGRGRVSGIAKVKAPFGIPVRAPSAAIRGRSRQAMSDSTTLGRIWGSEKISWMTR